MSTRLLIAPLLFLPTLALAKYEVNWSICDAGTQCKQCVERGALSELNGKRLEFCSVQTK